MDQTWQTYLVEVLFSKMAIRIPIQRDSTNYEIEVEIDGVEFLLRFKYNSVGDRWFIDILAIDGTCLRMGVPIVLNADIFSGWQEPERPQGAMYAFALGEPNDPPNLADLERGRVDILYIPFQELLAAP